MTFRECDKSFRVTHDTEADAAYIYLRPITSGGVARTVPVDISPSRGMVNLDFDSIGRLIGVEVIGVSALLPEGVLP
jgi:uncharacterized protein YuzE